MFQMGENVLNFTQLKLAKHKPRFITKKKNLKAHRMQAACIQKGLGSKTYKHPLDDYKQTILRKFNENPNSR